MTPLSALTSNPAPSPPPKFALGKCPATAIHVVSVLRPNRQRFCYEKTDAGDLIPHKCLICQPILTEKHISPYYAVYSDLLEDFVLFGYNTMTGKMEQFIYAFKTDCFVEVNRPEIKYNPAFLVKGNVVVALNGPEGELVVIERDCRGLLSKESTSYGQFRTLPTAALRTLTLQDLERDRWDRAANSDEVKISSGNESFDRLYAEYQKNLPRFQVRQCLHLNKEFLCVYSKTSGDYTRLEYIDETGDFQKISCTLCTCEVTESNLIPLYVERNASELVIHVHNTENNQIEQYIYDVRTFGFVQVKRNLVYDPKKITSGLNLFMAENIDNRKVYMIMRGRDGRLQKETSGSGGFEKMQPVAVKTFQVQWVEMKTEFEKKKASTERVEPQHPVQTEGEDIMETVLAMVESFNCDLRKELGLTQDQEIPRKAPRVESAETEENIVKNLEKLQIAKDPEEPTTAASEGGNTYGYQELDDTMSEGLLEKEAESKHQDANEPEPVKNVTYEPDVAAMDKKKKRRELKSRLNKINAQIDELEKRRMERAGKKQVVSSSVPSEEAAQVEAPASPALAENTNQISNEETPKIDIFEGYNGSFLFGTNTSKEWIVEDIRNHMVGKLLKAFWPRIQNVEEMNGELFKKLIANARKCETEILEASNDRDEYYRLMQLTVDQILKKTLKKDQRATEHNHQQPTQSSDELAKNHEKN